MQGESYVNACKFYLHVVDAVLASSEYSSKKDGSVAFTYRYDNCVLQILALMAPKSHNACFPLHACGNRRSCGCNEVTRKREKKHVSVIVEEEMKHEWRKREAENNF